MLIIWEVSAPRNINISFYTDHIFFYMWCFQQRLKLKWLLCVPQCGLWLSSPLGLQAGGSIAQELPAQHLPHPGFASGNLLSAGGRALPGSNPATLLEATQPPWLLTQVWDLQQPEDHLNFVMQAKGFVARKHHREQKKNRLLQESESKKKKKGKQPPDLPRCNSNTGTFPSTLLPVQQALLLTLQPQCPSSAYARP